MRLPQSPVVLALPSRGLRLLLSFQQSSVEHVTVNAGGQAIVGAVATPGGGVADKTEEQPHALTHAPGVSMRSPNETRELVPRAGDA